MTGQVKQLVAGQVKHLGGEILCHSGEVTCSGLVPTSTTPGKIDKAMSLGCHKTRLHT